jgi:hypothetical protein
VPAPLDADPDAPVPPGADPDPPPVLEPLMEPLAGVELLPLDADPDAPPPFEPDAAVEPFPEDPGLDSSPPASVSRSRVAEAPQDAVAAVRSVKRGRIWMVRMPG